VLPCTAEFLGATLSNSFAQGLLEESDRKGGTLKYVSCEKVIALAMKALRFFGELSEKRMKEATDAVRIREGLGDAQVAGREKLIREWEQDDDRVTDFCAALIGQKFLGMVDRAERLRAISVRTAVPEEVQRYLIEASICYIFGQIWTVPWLFVRMQGRTRVRAWRLPEEEWQSVGTQ
jgi:hypothetical protein